MALIKAENISKSFDTASGPVTALDDLSFAVEEQEFVAFLGPSGSGKSTLLRILAGIIQPSSGRVVYREGEKFERGDISFVFQDYALLPWKTAAGNLRTFLDLARLPVDDDRVHGHLEMVGLADYADAYPHELSGGMKQRVALARALVTDPELILMDEPFAALDALTKERLYDHFRRVITEADTTVVYVTHDIEEAYLFADRLLLLSADGALADRIELDAASPREKKVLSTDAFHETRQRVLDTIGGDVT